MQWMRRMFSEIIDERPPALVDLPTGSGKTDLVVIWLLALAWHGQNRGAAKPIPRRLLWVVNRRVLVQQVFRIADELKKKLEDPTCPDLNNVRAGLCDLSGNDDEPFRVVELRGQIVADRDWAIRPATPQLIVGTVDQIGSRLLFQGYGLGKWGRPQQAGLLGVDAWVAIDEAHLVPAFVITLRQLRERCATPFESSVDPIARLFSNLPFWLTELSATPGLPPPSVEESKGPIHTTSSVQNPQEPARDAVFSLEEEEKADEAVVDRILACETKRVLVERFPEGKNAKETKDSLILKLVNAAIESKAKRVAIFVREVKIADGVTAGVKSELKKRRITDDHICKITGRIRGYERDRLAQQKAFSVFVKPRDEANAEQWFLVGTAAAEVGLDADADAVFCDFAPLPTLLQRLGRLDRRGVLSRLHKEEKGEAPTLVVYASSKKLDSKLTEKANALAKALNADTRSYSASLMAGAHWLPACKEKEKNSSDDEKEEAAVKDIAPPLIEAATWSVLNPDNERCTAPDTWLKHDLAGLTSGPVIVPPVTDAVLDYWSATTDPRSPYLSPQPFLYGLGEDDEGTPLVGVAFRLEVEALRELLDDDETDAPDILTDVVEIFTRFPPLRSELHQIGLSAVRDWLNSDQGAQSPLVYRTDDTWHGKPAGVSTSSVVASLGPNSILIFPARVQMASDCKTLLKDCEQTVGKHTHISDVLDGVTSPERARYIRVIETSTHLVGADGALYWDFKSDSVAPPKTASPEGFKLRLSKRLTIGGTEYSFRYYRPHQENEQWQFLDDQAGERGHLTLAQVEAGRIAESIAPANVFLASLLSTAAKLHDEGKRLPKWQRAFGRPPGKPELAKLAPRWSKPGSLHGYRHEWESLRRLVESKAILPPQESPEALALWRDLLLHLVGVHHGHLRPSITDQGLTPSSEAEKQNPLRLEAAERFCRLQRQFGRWRLAYLEALLKSADAEGSRTTLEEEDDEQ